MIKVTIKGELYSFDNERYALHEAIALEEGLGITFTEWRSALSRGSAKAMAGFLWLVLKREGREVKLADIVSGDYALDEDDFSIEPEDDPAGPTAPHSPQDETSGSDT